ncbi:MAG: hypothetical protein ABIQ89_00840 [Candidatus Saccharimonadales bacterium]
MIREVAPDEAPQVFGLMERVYGNHTLTAGGVEAYSASITNGDYISVGLFEGDNLTAHAGIRLAGNFAIINALVVDPDRRGAGMGKAVFGARLERVRQETSVDFVAGYSMTQHLWSQKLYSDKFMPVGLDIGYPDIYKNKDSIYNRGMAFNAEIVLCQRLTDNNHEVKLSLIRENQSLARHILAKIGVDCIFDDTPSSNVVTNPNDTFLGFHPVADGGLFLPGYLAQGVRVAFDGIQSSNDVRGDFIESIRCKYEAAIRN